MLVLAVIAGATGCARRSQRSSEAMYVAAPQVNLRDRVAALYSKTGIVYNGEKVEVLEKSKRFVKVRSPRGEVGWMELRNLVDSDVQDDFTQMAAANRAAPVQAHAVARASLNMHVTPGRDTDHLFQLKEGERVEVLRRSTAAKPQASSTVLPREEKPTEPAAAKERGTAAPEGPPTEDWSLVRDAQGHTGWVLTRMMDIDVPLDIAQYSEGQRIVAYFILNQVQDADKKVPQYLVLLTENRDGLPWDFNQARIFTWNLKRHRYETAYRERNLNGVLPATTGSEDFGKDGVLPVFTLPVHDEQGGTTAKKYRLIGPIVRRVLSPQEEQREKEARLARPRARTGR